jgi:hypothetical protein
VLLRGPAELDGEQVVEVGAEQGAIALASVLGGESLTLLEPAIRDVPSAPDVLASLAPATSAYRHGDAAAAVDLFLQSVGGADYRGPLDGVPPDAFATAVARADVFFGAEMPIVAGCSFGPQNPADLGHRLVQFFARSRTPAPSGG